MSRVLRICGRGGAGLKWGTAAVPVLLHGSAPLSSPPFPLPISKPAPVVVTPQVLFPPPTQPDPHSWRPPEDAVWCGSSSGAGSRTRKTASNTACEDGLRSPHPGLPTPLGLLSPGCDPPLCTAPGASGSPRTPASPGEAAMVTLSGRLLGLSPDHQPQFPESTKLTIKFC